MTENEYHRLDRIKKIYLIMFMNLDLSCTKNIRERHKYYLEKAMTQALYSDCKHHKHGAIIVNRKTGDIISTGYNHYTEYMMHSFTCHAEMDAMSKLKKLPKTLFSDFELYVVRIGKESKGFPLKYSKPCVNCTKAILKYGIKRVYFSTDDNYTRNFGTL
jgi:deoxycytidylate deaminase